MSDCINSIQIKQGDTCLMQAVFGGCDEQSITGYGDFTKIEVKVRDARSKELLFSTELTDAYKITVIDNSNLRLIIPAADTLLMLGELILDTKYYFTLYDTEMVSSDPNNQTNITVVE